MAIDDLSPFFDDDTFAEEVRVDGVLVRGIFSTADELALDEVIVQVPTLQVRATVTAAIDDTCVIRAQEYRVRQVLDLPPDGAIYKLVLARVG